MGAVMTNISTTLRTLSCLIVILLFVMTVGCNHQRLKREAGFYTTRFGRSDPMMRFEELKTRFAPEVGETSKRLSHGGDLMGTSPPMLTLEDIKGRRHEPKRCVFSVRRGTFVCLNGESDPWKTTYFEYLNALQ